MTDKKKTPASAATGGEGSGIQTSSLHHSAFIALRKALLNTIRTGQCRHGALVTKAQDMGFTAAQARAAISSLVESGDAKYVAEDISVLVLPAADGEGRA